MSRGRPVVFLRVNVWLLVLLTAAFAEAQRTYHPVTIKQLATTRWTHVEVTGLVVYVRKQRDLDWHVTIIDSDGRKAVLELIPAIPLPVPAKGQRIRVRGISRHDRHHGYPEVHPVEHWEVLRE